MDQIDLLYGECCFRIHFVFVFYLVVTLLASYEELGLRSLQLRRWFRKLSCFYKLFKSEHPHYLFKLITSRRSSYVTRNIHNIPFFKTRHTFFKNRFFPLAIIEWNKLNYNIRNSSSFNIFRKVSYFLSGHLLIVFLIVIIPKESSLSLDCGLF